jgi:hypothetical protein
VVYSRPSTRLRKITISILSRQRVELLPYLVEVSGRIGTLGRGAAEANAGLVAPMLAIVGGCQNLFLCTVFSKVCLASADGLECVLPNP